MLSLDTRHWSLGKFCIAALLALPFACSLPAYAQKMATPTPQLGNPACAALAQRASAAIAESKAGNANAAGMLAAINAELAAEKCPALPAISYSPQSSQAGVVQSSPSFSLISDKKPASDPTATLCLAVNGGAPLAMPARPDSGLTSPPLEAGTFYPVVVIKCGAIVGNEPSTWTASNARELQITVNHTQMCLSGRFSGGTVYPSGSPVTISAAFTPPLLIAFLNAFGALTTGSPFGYLTGSTQTSQANSQNIQFNPYLVASPCGRADAVDFWTYDDLSGTVSGPAGSSLSVRKCVSIDGDARNLTATRYDTGMPVYAADCRDVEAPNRLQTTPADHWTMSQGRETLPTYPTPPAGDYFSGRGGLPIVGPMGKCLTRDGVTWTIAVTSDCDGRYEQDWKFITSINTPEQKSSYGRIQLGNADTCLTAAPDGTVTLNPCSNAEGQVWFYHVLLPTPSQWSTNDPLSSISSAVAYAMIQPGGDQSRCLVVSNDPFADPVVQRNRVKTATCSSLPASEENWFLATTVRTVRMGLLRFSDDNGSNLAAGNSCPGSTFALCYDRAAALAAYLSAEFHVLGVRFVFDPIDDVATIADTVGNEYDQYSACPNVLPNCPTNWHAANEVTKYASTKMYGRMTIALVADHPGGDLSSGDFVEYDPNLILDPVGGGSLYDYTANPALPLDAAGLPALSAFALASDVEQPPVSSMPHEIGHYFALGHTFNQDLLGDTPHDTGDGSGWLRMGTTTCGNPRTGPSSFPNPQQPSPVTPDRLNNEGYWGCAVGRANNAFSPLQLATENWVLQNQLNRYPLVACQPAGAYDADSVKCENAGSFKQCEKTAAYLKQNVGAAVDCEMGGIFASQISTDLQKPEVVALFTATSAGRSLLAKLDGIAASGNPPTQTEIDTVFNALKNCTILPVTMAIANRLDGPRGFEAQLGTQGTAGVNDALANAIFTPGFIAHVPTVAVLYTVP